MTSSPRVHDELCSCLRSCAFLFSPEYRRENQQEEMKPPSTGFMQLSISSSSYCEQSGAGRQRRTWAAPFQICLNGPSSTARLSRIYKEQPGVFFVVVFFSPRVNYVPHIYKNCCLLAGFADELTLVIMNFHKDFSFVFVVPTRDALIRFRAIKSRTNRLRNSFYPKAVVDLNTANPSETWSLFILFSLNIPAVLCFFESF